MKNNNKNTEWEFVPYKKEAIKNNGMMKNGGKLPKAADGWENLSPSEKFNWYKNNEIYNNQNLTETDFLSSVNNPAISDFYKDLFNKQNITTQQPPLNINTSANTTPTTNTVSNSFNYGIKPDVRKIDPLYSKMRQQTTPTGVKYEPPIVDVAGWNLIENQLKQAHTNGIPFSDNAQGYYGNIQDKQQLTNLGFQEQYYDDMLETSEGRKELAKMWQSKGKTLKGINLPTKTDNLTSLNDAELYEQLNKLRPAYLDSYPKVRKGEKYVNPNPTKFTAKQKPTPVGDDPKLQSKITGEADKTKGSFNMPQILPMPIANVYGEDPAARFELQNREVPFRRLSPQQQINEVNRNTRAGLNLLGNTPTDVSNMANLLTQANVQGQQAINTINQQNTQNQMGIDQFNTQLGRQRDLSQMQEDVRFTDNIARRKAAIQQQNLLDTNQGREDLADMFTEQRYNNLAEKIYPSKTWENYQFNTYDPTKFDLTSKDEKKDKKAYGGKIKSKLTKKSSK